MPDLDADTDNKNLKRANSTASIMSVRLAVVISLLIKSI
jgi:hypothetical protein